MTDEIKEILDRLKLLCYDDYCLEFSVDYIERKEEKLLLDYITNLQEENERLNKQLEYLRGEEYLNQVKWERDFNEKLVEDYKSRVVKAIHLIYHNDIYDYRVFEEMLLNILQGGN